MVYVTVVQKHNISISLKEHIRQNFWIFDVYEEKVNESYYNYAVKVGTKLK